ncbi:MFS transporter [Rhodoferax antarcticus]|uniref:MFS transporter n=1 Tax=Rhodoferax antarcticus TaxID=81479 RepID=UPI0022243F23|nr:MFS transporter [Rhodoferax antarcticus]MCW2313827.1 Na+/melibiose symporter-like transporter [Rhodoferax antarcticus]
MNPALTWQQGWRYGLMGLPLAFVALPLYVLLPNHYARSFGLSLATLGAVLVAARLFDAVIDPLLGRWADNLHQRSRTTEQAPATVLRWAALAALLLCIGFGLLFFPPLALQADTTQVMLWLAATLLLTTTAFSALTILHQAWGARLGGDALYRSRVVAWREGLGLVGVIIASITPVALGLPATVALLVIASVGGWVAWRSGPVPLHLPNATEPATFPHPNALPAGAVASATTTGQAADLQPEPPLPGRRPVSVWLPWQRSRFRQLMGVFMVNGIASAIPATLLLFFVQDRLKAPPSAEPLFLGAYFVCAALSIPLWLKLVARFGLARTWLLGMVLSVLVFAFAARLGAGDVTEFVIVCALSGAALGTDLALPAALLAGVIQHHGDQQQSEGAYFGWWAFATKLNLALAAGVALPALGLLGYTPGTTDPQALQTLTFAYCLLPCALKTLAAALLYFLIIRKKP